MHKNRRELLQLSGQAALLLPFAGLCATQAFADARIDLPKLDSPALLSRIKAISNVFEVGGPDPDYAYVEDLGDGRGYTVTQYGFCTYNSEVAEVIGRYAAHVPDTPLTRFLAFLPPAVPVVRAGSLDGFPESWRAEIKLSKWLGAACDAEANRLYLVPALAVADAAGVRSAVGKSIFYDTWLQHGGSTDPDSLPSILKRTITESGSLAATSEAAFLRAFLGVRKAVLHEPANHKTRDVWRASARRVDALLLLLDNNPDLAPPIEVSNADIHVTIL